MITVEEYTEACLKFAGATQEFRGLNDFNFYTTSNYGEKKYGGLVVKTTDNAHGGLDVTWAFHQLPEYIKKNAAFYYNEIQKVQR